MKCQSCGRSDIPDGAGWCCWCGKKLLKTRAKKNEIKVPEPVQLPSGSWRIVLRKEGQSITEATPELCKAKAIAIRAGFIDGAKTGSITLTKAIDKYIEAKSNILSPSTIRGYRSIQKNRFQAYMNKDITKITPNQWQKAVNEETKFASPKTVKNSWMFINSVLEFSGVNRVNVTVPQEIPHSTAFLTPSEIDKFVDGIHGTDIEIPCLLGLSSLRRSEVHALKWEDIDLQKRVIYVRRAMVQDEHEKWQIKETNKNVSSNRVVPIMMDNLYEALSAARKEEGQIVELSPNTIRNRIRKVCRDLEITEISFHGLRHSFASLAAHIGMPEAVAMQIGGWSNDKIMKRIYTHVLETDVNRYQNEMSEYYNLHTNLHTVSKNH